jgi:D-glycero-alpha-D-manno-heptose-7-phosphate kinase
VSPYCDIYGGIVLNATIDRYCYATLEETADGSIEFRAPDIEVTDRLTQGLESAGPTRLNLHRAIYERLTRDFDPRTARDLSDHGFGCTSWVGSSLIP